MDRGQIKGFVKRTLVRRAFSEETKHCCLGSFQSRAQRGPNRDGDTAAHNAVGAQHATRDVGDMHAAAFATAVPVGAAQHFGQHPARIQAASQRMPVATMRAGQQVVRLHRCARACCNRLHADIEVSRPRNQTGLV